MATLPLNNWSVASIRQTSGISLEEIARNTKLKVTTLKAIEDANFDVLPGGIYNISYIRQYARAIGADEGALVKMYQSLRPDDNQSQAKTGVSRIEHPKPESRSNMAAAVSFSTQISASQAVLGKDVTVTGEIRSHEPLIIEGEVEGTIDVAGHLLTIAPNGKVRASVQAKEIDDMQLMWAIFRPA